MRRERLLVGPLLDEHEGVAGFVQQVQLAAGLAVHLFDGGRARLSRTASTDSGLAVHGGDGGDGVLGESAPSGTFVLTPFHLTTAAFRLRAAFAA